MFQVQSLISQGSKDASEVTDLTEKLKTGGLSSSEYTKAAKRLVLLLQIGKSVCYVS